MAKTKSLLEQAQDLGKSKYAPALTELEEQLKTNLSLYTNASGQRVEGLNREVGSINAAGATAASNISKYGAQATAAYENAKTSTMSNTKDLLDKVNANNSSMLSTLQADMRARGITGYEQLSPLTQNMSSRNELLAAMGQFGLNRLEAQKGAGIEGTNSKLFMSEALKNTAGSQARGLAQSDLSDLYNRFLEAKMGLDTSKTKTKLEKEDYINQLYLTLKDKAAQEKAAKAQAKAAAAAAAGNLAYKYTALETNTQYKYDKLASDTAQKDIENKLKADGFSHKQATDIAKLALNSKELQHKIDTSNSKNSILEMFKGLGGLR